MIDKGQEIFDGTVSQLKETFGKMKTLSFELLPGQNHLVSHYEGLPDMTIDRQGNSLNIEFDSSRYQSADIIKQTLSDFEVRDLKMVDTDIEGYYPSLLSKGALRWSNCGDVINPLSMQGFRS